MVKKKKTKVFYFFFNLEKILQKRSLKISEILKYVVLSSLFPAFALSFLFLLNPVYVFTKVHYSLISTLFMVEINPITLFLGVIIFAIATLYIKSIFLHVFSILLRGKGKFKDTFNAVGIALIPFLIFGWIPILGIWAFFYALTLLIYGLSIKQRFSILKSAAVLTISLIILLLVIISILPIQFFMIK